MADFTSKFDVFKSNTFVPLHVGQNDLHVVIKKLEGKKIIIWGAGHLGKILFRLLKRAGYERLIVGFVDNNPGLKGALIMGLPVLNPHEILEEFHNKRIKVLIANSANIGSIKLQLQSAGLVEKEDYISFLSIPRPEAVIQLVTVEDQNINLFSNDVDAVGRKIMPLENYKKILDRLISDVPLISHIDLSGFSEPLLHPNLDQIIRYTEQVVPCTVTTKLSASILNIKSILDSKPSQFVVVASGFRDSYEKNTLGLSWNSFKEKLEVIANLKSRYEKDTEFRVSYPIYANNSGLDFSEMSAFCERLNIKFVKSTGYINSYDETLKLFQGMKLTPISNIQLMNLNWNLYKAMGLAALDREMPCLCQRIFPVINYDGSVGICHLYQEPIVEHNILNVSYQSLLDKRAVSSHCKKCQSYALHRLDIDVLNRRYPDFDLENSGQK